MAIRQRLAVVFSVATALLVAVGGIVFVTQLQRSLNASINAGLRSRMAAIQNAANDSTSGPELQDGPADTLAPSEPLAQILQADGTVTDTAGAAGDRPLLGPSQLAAAARGPVLLSTKLPGFQARTRLYASRIQDAKGTHIAIVGTSLDTTEDAVDRVRTELLVAGLPIVAAAGMGAWLLAGAALRPVERMRQQAATISERELDTGLDVPSTRDEVAALASTMNELLARLQGALARERAFVADAGHELRTPLAILRTELELANRPGRSQAELAQAVSEAVDETERVARLAEDLLSLARAEQGPDALQASSVDLAAIVDDAVRAATARARTDRVHVITDAPPELVVAADRDRIRRAIDNLIDNALRFAPPESAVRIRACRSADGVTIEVADEGPGFPAAFLPHAFKRFGRSDHSRARSDGGGAGLGLAIVQAIARAHGGSAVAENGRDHGAIVRIHLPAGLSTSPPSRDG